jgi:hypothetical protein
MIKFAHTRSAEHKPIMYTELLKGVTYHHRIILPAWRLSQPRGLEGESGLVDEWDRNCEVSLSYQCLTAYLSSTVVVDEASHTAIAAHNILVATSNSSGDDLDLKCECHSNKASRNLIALTAPLTARSSQAANAGMYTSVRTRDCRATEE